MKKLTFILLLLISSFLFSNAEVITMLKTDDKAVALTFDACETKTPSYLDHKITDFLVSQKIPFTLFVSGKFIERNFQDLKNLYNTGLVSIQNHSYNHNNHMELLSEEEIKEDVLKNENLIIKLTGIKPKYFRFPAGNYDEKALRLVESLGYKVVHWTFPSGDPDKKITKEMLIDHVIRNTKPGSILIFHANGRGYKTGEALPEIVRILKQKGYRFVRLEDYLF